MTKYKLVLIIVLYLLAGCKKDDPPPPPPSTPPDPCDSINSLIPQTHWEVNAQNPVMDVEQDGNWDGEMVNAPAVILYKDTFRMWYEGSTEMGLNGTINIGYAWSLDGVDWHRRNTPVLLADSNGWDGPHVTSPTVFVDGDTLRMWYGGGNYTESGKMAIGYAISVDGIHWNRKNSPVMVGNKPWDKDGVMPGPVLKENGVYKMWFSGGINHIGYSEKEVEWSTGYATSPNGINWTVKDDPVLEHGSLYSWDGKTALCGTVFKTNTGYEMWYSGQEGYGITLSSIGYATSTDGLTWQKFECNPVLNRSKASVYLAGPRVVEKGNKYYMWYSGWHQGPGIHFATSVK